MDYRIARLLGKVILFFLILLRMNVSDALIVEKGRFYWRENGRTFVVYFDNSLNIYKDPSIRADIVPEVSYSDRYIALAHKDMLRIYTRDGVDLLKYKPPKFSISSLVFLPDQCSILVGMVDGSVLRIYFCRRNKDRQIERYPNHWSMVTSLWVHPNQKIFISGDITGTSVITKLYDSDFHGGTEDVDLMRGLEFIESGRKITLSTTNSSEVIGIVGSEYVVMGYKEGILEIFDLRGKVKLPSVKAHTGLLDLMYLHKQQLFLTLGEDRVIKIFKVVMLNGGLNLNKIPRLVVLARLDLDTLALQGQSQLVALENIEDNKTSSRESVIDSKCQIRAKSFFFVESLSVLIKNVLIRSSTDIVRLMPDRVGREEEGLSLIRVKAKGCKIAPKANNSSDAFLGLSSLDLEFEEKEEKLRNKIRLDSLEATSSSND